MGRGLSGLQKTMLVMASSHREPEGAPGMQRGRVLLLDDPAERDLRSLAPEAFSEEYPDGLWEATRHAFYLIAREWRVSFGKSYDERKSFAEGLRERGLSPVGRGAGNDYQCDLFTSDALIEIYGLKRRFWPPQGHPPGFPEARYRREWCNTDHPDPAYKRSARAAVSRAFDRLAERGLAQRRGAAINLTDRGLKVAGGLTAIGYSS